MTFKSIKNKVLTSHISLVLLLSVALGFSSYYFLVEHLESLLMDKLTFSAEHGADMLNNSISSYEHQLSEIANGRSLEIYAKKYRMPLLRKYLGGYKDSFNTLSYINDKGEEELKYVEGKLTEALSNVEGEEVFNEITWKPNNIYVSEPAIDKDRQPLLKMGIMRQSFFGEFIGIIIGSIHIEELAKRVTFLIPGNTGTMALMDMYGRVIYHSNKEFDGRVITGKGKAADFITSAESMKTVVKRMDLFGIDGYVAHSPVKGLGMSVMYTMPYKEFITFPNKVRNFSIGLSMIILVIGILLAMKMSSDIAGPILKLSKVTRKFGEYDFDQRINLRSRDEIGLLGDSFNNMADALQKTISERDVEIGERRLAEDQVRKLTLGVEQSPTSIIITDATGHIEYVNPKFVEISGFTYEEVEGKTPSILNSGKQSIEFYKNLWNTILSGKEWRGELHNKKKSGELHWESVSISPIKNSDGDITHFIALKEEVTHRKEAEKALEHKAFYDQLTGLPNRTLFSKHLKRVFRQARENEHYQFAICFMDLDRFKVINDSLGHIVGDKLLIEVARRLEACIRPNDSVARFGGDEFAVLLDRTKYMSEATQVADRIQHQLQFPFELDSHEVFTSASIGIALSSSEYDQEDEILRDADSAMYRAKARGKARYEIFDSDMHKSAMKLMQMESDLRRAVERDEFIVHYQPVQSLSNGRICGAEALVRWLHPEHNLIPPLDFIPLAEETGLISSIGEFVLKTAVGQNRAWQEAGYDPILMKVNFSSRQFHHKNIVEIIKDVIRNTDLLAEHLDIEITESIATEEGSIVILNELSRLGIQISIDDFGTGYSSLGAIKRFPINTLKIDRSFIRDIIIDKDDEAIVKAIIAMAHNLKMKVVAEGVEKEDQLAFLKANDCDEIQGYLISKPLSSLEFTKLLEKEKKKFSSDKLA